VRVLRRILRRWCAGFCATLRGPLEMLVGQLEVVFPRNLRTIADPPAYFDCLTLQAMCHM
jgi:hypothetical protein